MIIIHPCLLQRDETRVINDTEVRLRGPTVRQDRFDLVLRFPERFFFFFPQCGRTPLHLAAHTGSLEVVRHLCLAGANIDAVTHVSQNSDPDSGSGRVCSVSGSL